MGTAPKIILAATIIAFSSEWYQTDKPNFRIPVAGILMAWVFQGIENLDENAGIGLALIAFTTSLLAPVKGQKSPVDVAAKIVGSNRK